MSLSKILLKQLSISALWFISAYTLMWSCANPVQPTGGPKDTIPPVLVKTIPEDQSLNFSDDKIELVFDEAIQAANIKSELIITPRLERDDYRHKVKKDRLIITFEKPLQSNTTYSFNFSETVEDLTEKNKAPNIKLSFSTGNYIDSVRVSGTVKDHISQQPFEKAVVGLYYANDTLDPLNAKPVYFTRTLADGTFELGNLKDTTYRIFAFNDSNSDLQVNTKSEPFAFVPDTLIRTGYQLDSINLSLITNDIAPLKLQRASQAGLYYALRYNKPLKEFSITSDTTLTFNLIDDNTGVRFYNTIQKDSVKIYTTAVDSVDFISSDTLFVKFRESKNKPEAFEILEGNSKSATTSDFQEEIKLNKPVLTLTADSILIRIDTILFIQPDTVYIQNDYKSPNLQIKHTFNQERVLKQINQRIDSLNIVRDTLTPYPPVTTVPPFHLQIPYGSVISIEQDTLSEIDNTYRFFNPQDVGSIFGTIETEEKSFILQLIYREEVVREHRNSTDYKFDNLSPGDYSIRILIDSNNDGLWSKGNYLKNELPEPVYNYPQTIPVKSNWEIQNNPITF